MKNVDEWSLNVEGAELDKEVPSKPDALTILTPTKSEIERIIAEKKVDCFSGLFNTPTSSEVKVLKTETVYQPFLIITGRYIARYLRKNNYEWKVNSDVVTVKIVEDVLNVDSKPFKVSNLLAKGVSGLSVGNGIIGFSCEPLEEVVQKGLSKVIGKHDMALLSGKKLCLSLLEHAVHDTKEKTIIYDASTASIVEAPKISKLINGAKSKTGRPTGCKEILDYKKALKDAENKLVEVPDGRVLEHKFRVSDLNVVFVPKIYATLKYKGQTKELVLDGVNLEPEED